MILLRHGESEWNALFSRTRIDPGIPDPGLTELGRRQIGHAVRMLAGCNIESLISSPYVRTLQTAEIIADKLNVPIRVEPLVRERAAFSCDVGTERSLLADRWPHLSFGRLKETWWPDQTETETDLRRRCQRFSRSVQAFPNWRCTVVVTHWGFIRGLTGIEVRNGQLIRFDPSRDAENRLQFIEPDPVPW
jgi:broad specificity phosphatase PhoE